MQLDHGELSTSFENQCELVVSQKLELKSVLGMIKTLATGTACCLLKCSSLCCVETETRACFTLSTCR